MPTVVTANSLRSGAVVYLGGDSRWVESLAQAITADSEGARTELEIIASRSVAANQVVGPYLIDVAMVAGVAAPISVREMIRAQRGPTV